MMNQFIIYILTGLVAGFASGSLGIGGGILMVPIFFYLLKLPMHTAIGSSLAIIVFTAIAGSIKHWQSDNIHFKLVFFIAIFSIIGSYAGAWACEKMPADLLRKLFAIMLMGTAIKMFFK